MGIQVVTIAVNQATNSVANSTAIDLAAAAQLQAGPAFPNVGAGNAVLMIEIDPGTTPGAYDIAVAESDDDTTFTNLTNGAIDEATVGSTIMRNVTVSGRYIRLEVEVATANAGTVSAWLISG